MLYVPEFSEVQVDVTTTKIVRDRNNNLVLFSVPRKGRRRGLRRIKSAFLMQMSKIYVPLKLRADDKSTASAGHFLWPGGPDWKFWQRAAGYHLCIRQGWPKTDKKLGSTLWPVQIQSIYYIIVLLKRKNNSKKWYKADKQCLLLITVEQLMKS